MSRLIHSALLLLLAGWLTGCGGDNGAQQEMVHLARAEMYRNNDQLRAAMIELKNALKYDERNPNSHLQLGELQMRLGETREARLSFERAGRFGLGDEAMKAVIANTWLEEHKPLRALQILGDLNAAGVSDAHLLAAAGAQLRLDELDAADQLLRRVDPARGAALLALREAELAHKRGMHDVAIRKVDAALKQDETLADAWLLQAALHFAAEDYSLAMDSFYRVVSLEGGESQSRRKVRAVHGIVRCEVAQGMVDGAYNTYRELLGEAQGRLLADYEQGLARYREHDIDGAISALMRLQRDVPKHPPTLFLLGVLNYERGALAESVEYLEKLTAIDPDNTLAVKLLAVIALEQSRPRAATHLLGSISHQPDWNRDIELQLLLADAHLRSGEREIGLKVIGELLPKLSGDWRQEARAARLYLRAGEAGRAVGLLSPAMDRGETKEPVSALLATALVDAGQVEQARAHLHRWRERDGETPAVRFAEAVLEHRSGRAEQARVMLEATVREHPGHRAARRYLAELQVANGEVAAAARHYAELLRTEAGDAQSAARLASLIVGEDAGLARRDVLRALEGELAAQMALARGVASLSDWGTLEQIAAQLRRGAPASDEALLLHVAAMRGLGRDEEAEQQCLDALNRSALRVSANLCLAVQALKQADLPQVVDRAERVLREQPDSVEARELLAQAYLRDRALDHARDQIEQLKQLRGGQPRAYALEGMLWAERGDAQAAVQAWQRSWELREDRSTLMPYARALQLVEQHAEAQLLLEGWLTVNPGDVSVRRAAATAALSAGQRRAALRHYQTLISLRPEDVIALNNLAWLYHEQGDKRALEYARSAYELDAKNPSVADTYGWLLAKSGRRVAGEQVLTQALTANPNNSGLRERLAAIRSL